ncbi:MAG: serine/threonine-protein kinase [Myxococcota bacterium]
MQRVSVREPVGLPRNGLDPGAVLDERYRLVERISQGELGQVFRVHDARLKREVVIKQLHARIATDPSLRATFVRAAEIMANLHHPNVVTVHDAGGWDSLPYLVMPCEDGMRLDLWVRQCGEPLAIDTAMEILDQICAGLSAMHQAGIIHGNVKPSTVLVSETREVTLVDLALHPHMGTLQDIHDPTRVLGFEAPELIRRDGVDAQMAPKLDVYSLGVIAYWLLTGQSPWERTGDALVRPFAADVTPPSELRTDLCPDFDAPILQALRVEPGRRPRVDQLHARLRKAFERSDARNTPFIVVVDDDHVSLTLAENVARVAVEHAEVVGVPDPRSALAIIGMRRPDLVVTDLSMPQLNGIEFTAALRGNNSTASVPVIVVTGVGGANEWKLLHAMGAESLIVKPIRPQMLNDAIRRVLKLDAESA